MPQLACSDFGEFESALRAVNGRYLFSGRAMQDWRVHIADLGEVALMLGQDGAGNLFNGAGLSDRINVFISLTASETIAVNGCEVGRESIAWLAPEKEFHIRASGVTRWLAVSIATQRVARRLKLHADSRRYGALANNLVFKAAPSGAMYALMRLVRRVLQAEANRPAAFEAPFAKEILCQQLEDALLATLPIEEGISPEVGRPRLNRQAVVERAIGKIDECIDKPIHTDELCGAAEVSERTLRTIFREQFGMTPHRYVMLKRLRAIHLALRTAGPSDTVSGICGRYGVWDFGRFARLYRLQFGVLPSEVLGACHTAVEGVV